MLLYTVVVQLQFLRVICNEEMMHSNKFQCLLCPNAIIMLVMSIMRNMRKPCEIMRELCRNYAEIIFIMRKLCNNYAEIMQKLCGNYASIMCIMQKLCGNYAKIMRVMRIMQYQN